MLINMWFLLMMASTTSAVIEVLVFSTEYL